ncbi:DNA integrity scanning protein DisA [bacterium BMS3Bbin06]|nr:DNA integrity scanning protein DisA [bacterium BMS3Abin08]GBE34426.1 DNA integrity scanning protein DisA [bacterium BMS3Bbin06]HDO36305.1 TIGR00159 family protein [Nitrospirota bacterium]HDY70311.1 TIGR00159 family protein [Nitrospirota bacterium]
MLEIIKHIRWQDILDILIVAVVLYRILLLIKGTRAVQMLIGLGVLLVALFLSDYLKLHTMYWIIQSFWAQVVLALIILFQPEIRKALAHMGETSFFPAITSASEFKSIDEIVRAAVSLANRRIGALIVLERVISLKDFVEIGTPLDAKVSREILLSIFHPTSPIHDGAVIIRGDRIVAAGCFLPITFRRDLDRSLGTRHRAALGITEETDSLVIIVSEETGMISLARDGRIETPMDMGSLRGVLTDIFTETKR